MDIFVSFVVFILSVLSVESTMHMKSIKLSKNVIYDCMDIYKQPSLSHPLLKHHNIQMKPTGWDSQSENKFAERKNKNKIECPNGTVPILRTKKKHVIQSQEYPINNFTVLTAKYPGTHIAGMKIVEKHNYRGVAGGLRTYNLIIDKNQSTSAQAYVATASNDDANSIQVGWMINEQLFGDKRPWSYGSWLGKHGTGCFNVQCPGFVQVAKNGPISEPLKLDYLLWLTIHQDKETKNWWLTQTNPGDVSKIHLGYWPKELFNLLGDGADFVGFGGIVTGDPRTPSPPMGNGRLPNKDDRLWSGYLDHLTIIEPNYTHAGFNDLMTVPLVDSSVCYDVNYVGYVDEHVGIAVSYGGPGGIKCGD
ncbi:Neprosin activation peptide [Arabidopsis suecica]|uniref:Neprosin activation peptide n=1 Tax=Arabidopsis suecica TaxID=45249 RepID=A0A8T1YPK1_ARASU|nr:Neprosin activation peptide [Arabidopsis suecica]